MSFAVEFGSDNRAWLALTPTRNLFSYHWSTGYVTDAAFADKCSRDASLHGSTNAILVNNTSLNIAHI